MNENPQCPQHGDTMVWREGRYGEFWGCSKYASDNCKYVWKPDQKPQPAKVAIVGKSATSATSVAPIVEKIGNIKTKLAELQTLWNELEQLL